MFGSFSRIQKLLGAKKRGEKPLKTRDKCILIGTKYAYVICSYYDNGECLSPATKEELCLPLIKRRKDVEKEKKFVDRSY